jgi:hypothetical protein
VAGPQAISLHLTEKSNSQDKGSRQYILLHTTTTKEGFYTSCTRLGVHRILMFKIMNTQTKLNFKKPIPL